MFGLLPCRVSSNTTNEPWRLWNERENSSGPPTPWSFHEDPGSPLRFTAKKKDLQLSHSRKHEAAFRIGETGGGLDSCPPDVYGPWTVAGELEHMELICRLHRSMVWWSRWPSANEMLQALHVPGIRDSRLNSSPGLGEPHKYIQNTNMCTSTGQQWKMWAQTENIWDLLSAATKHNWK